MYFLNTPDMVFDFSGHAELANFPGLKEGLRFKTQMDSIEWIR